MAVDDVEDMSTHPLMGPSTEDHATVPVFRLIHQLRKDVDEHIDTALSWEQLNAPDVNFTITRPLVSKYDNLNNPALIYGCLLVRWHYLSAADEDLAHSGILNSRAAFCELMAIKLLRSLASNRMDLVHAITTSWSALQGASGVAIAEITRSVGANPEEMEEPMNALELGVSSQAKFFMSSLLVQGVVTEIWSGRILYSTTSLRSLLADNYKTRQITIYDARVAPLLNHNRLRVPQYRSILDFINYCILLVTFVVCLGNRDYHQVNASEIIFIVFAFGFVLEEYAASQEHGWNIYAANMWNAFDLTWIATFLVYFALRMRGLWTQQASASELAFDVLACSAVVLFPRVAFLLLVNNVVVLALRSMIKEYLFFISIGGICFSGLLFTLWTLGSKSWRLKQIAWLMVQVWFGNTFLSFTQAESFHPFFGPILMVIFAAVANTLLITILISILSNTFAKLNQFATQEFLFQYAISTLEGVKSDAIFSYQSPFNLLAYVVLWPLTRVLSPRALHSTNVFLIRLTSFPVLFTIGVYERYFAPGSRFLDSGRDAGHSYNNILPRQLKKVSIVEAFIGSNNTDLLNAVFDAVPPLNGSLFQGEESEEDGLSQRGGSRQPPDSPRLIKFPDQPRQLGRSRSPAGRDTSRRRVHSHATTINHGATASPLAKLFTRGPGSITAKRGDSQSADIVDAARRVEDAIDELKDLPIQRLANDVRDLQERQARIEALLQTLTRGMRGDTVPPPPAS